MNKKIKVRISSLNIDYLLKDLINKKIDMYDIKKDKKSLEIIINKKDYKKISKIKTIKKIDIIDYYGINKLEFILKKNSIFFMLVILGIIINILLSNIIFKIEVETPNKILEENIIKELEKLGLKKYRFKITYNKKEKIKEKLKKINSDKIEYIEIEEQGTKYIVKVEEKKLNKENDDCDERNIVARKNAIITKINSSSGEISKKINDYVVKGEILISGEIHNKENVVEKKCVKGKVLGETWYKVKVEIDKNTIEKKYTNKNKLGLSINFLGYNKEIFNTFSTFEKKEYNIIEGKLIPISISLSKYMEVKKIVRKNKVDNIDKKALDIATKKLLKENNLITNIIRKKVLKKSINNSKIIIEVFIAAEEDITDYEKIIPEEESNVRTTYKYNSGGS